MQLLTYECIAPCTIFPVPTSGCAWPPKRSYMQLSLSLRARTTGYVPDRSLAQAATSNPSFLLPQLMLQDLWGAICHVSMVLPRICRVSIRQHRVINAHGQCRTYGYAGGAERSHYFSLSVISEAAVIDSESRRSVIFHVRLRWPHSKVRDVPLTSCRDASNMSILYHVFLLIRTICRLVAGHVLHEMYAASYACKLHVQLIEATNAKYR